jgi:hypothetical protein
MPRLPSSVSLYCIVEGTASVAVGEAQARALTELARGGGLPGRRAAGGALGALTQLFTNGPWLPAAIGPGCA